MIEGIIYCYHSPSNKYYIGQTIHESKRKSPFFERQKEAIQRRFDNGRYYKT